MNKKLLFIFLLLVGGIFGYKLMTGNDGCCKSEVVNTEKKPENDQNLPVTENNEKPPVACEEKKSDSKEEDKNVKDKKDSKDTKNKKDKKKACKKKK